MKELSELKELIAHSFEHLEKGRDSIIPSYMSMEELWELSSKLTYLNHDDLRVFLPIVLVHLLESIDQSEEESMTYSKVCLFLEQPYATSEEQELIRNLYTENQRSILIRWLEFMRTLPALQFDAESIDNAVCYWRGEEPK